MGQVMEVYRVSIIRQVTSHEPQGRGTFGIREPLNKSSEMTVNAGVNHVQCNIKLSIPALQEKLTAIRE
jgi:hypothetical protein